MNTASHKKLHMGCGESLAHLYSKQKPLRAEGPHRGRDQVTTPKDSKGRSRRR